MLSQRTIAERQDAVNRSAGVAGRWTARFRRLKARPTSRWRYAQPTCWSKTSSTSSNPPPRTTGRATAAGVVVVAGDIAIDDLAVDGRLAGSGERRVGAVDGSLIVLLEGEVEWPPGRSARRRFRTTKGQSSGGTFSMASIVMTPSNSVVERQVLEAGTLQPLRDAFRTSLGKHPGGLVDPDHAASRRCDAPRSSARSHRARRGRSHPAGRSRSTGRPSPVERVGYSSAS